MAYTLVPTELIVDGAVTSAKLDTNISISGTLGVTGELTLATHMIMGDNDKIKIGTGGDLEIYHDGSNSYISNSTGNIYLADTNGSVHIQAKLNEESIVCAADGAVTLYHDNTPKLATSSSGIDVTGTVVADGLTVDGTGSFTQSSNAATALTTFTNSNAGASARASISFASDTGLSVVGTVSSGWTVDALNANETFMYGSNGVSLFAPASQNVRILAGGSERLRVDSSGRVIVSSAGSPFGADSVTIDQGGFLAIRNTSGSGMEVRRDSTDGSFIDFQKDGSPVGSIGTTGGELFLGSTANTDAFIRMGYSGIVPATSTGANRDAAIDFGTSSNRFKDLYLSGTANVGNVSSGSASSASEIIATSLDNGTSFGSNRMLKLVGTSTTDNSRMGIHFTGNTGIGNGLGIIEAVNEDQSAGHTSLRMHTYSGSWNENNLVLKSGSVGIGTSSLSRQLQLYKSSNSAYSSSSMETTNLQLYIRNADTTVNNHVGLQFAVGNNSDAAIAGVRTADANAALTFGTRGTGSGNIIERMRVSSDGDIRINTTGQMGNATLTVKAYTNTNTGLMLQEYDTSNAYGLYTVTSDDSFRITRFVSGAYSDRLIIDSNGSFGINTSSLSTEASLFIGKQPSAGNQEGGQLVLQSSVNGSKAIHIDNYNNASTDFCRFMRGTDTNSEAVLGVWDITNTRFGIGTATPAQTLTVAGSAWATGYYITALQGNAQLTNASTSSGSNPSYIGQGLISVTVSDAKAKENFSSVETNECLNKIVSLSEHVKKFDWIDEDWKREKGRTVGIVAQEIYEDHSEFVHKPENYDDDGWAIRYQEIVPTLIKAIQEQQTIIDDLKSRIETLENE